MRDSALRRPRSELRAPLADATAAFRAAIASARSLRSICIRACPRWTKSPMSTRRFMTLPGTRKPRLLCTQAADDPSRSDQILNAALATFGEIGRDGPADPNPSAGNQSQKDQRPGNRDTRSSELDQYFKARKRITDFRRTESQRIVLPALALSRCATRPAQSRGYWLSVCSAGRASGSAWASAHCLKAFSLLSIWKKRVVLIDDIAARNLGMNSF
jgi:hypothetical protein